MLDPLMVLSDAVGCFPKNDLSGHGATDILGYRLVSHIADRCQQLYSSQRMYGAAFAELRRESLPFWQFDDIHTVAGFANVTRPYHHLAFSAYNVFAPRDPHLKNWVTENDHNCAVSSPNALIGSRSNPDADQSLKGAYFEIANPAAMIGDGLRPYFTLKSLSIKPMEAPPPGTTISVKGSSSAQNKTFEWHVDFPSGYHLPFLVNFQEYSREPWDELHGVEIVADFGEQALDWEFCLDDLEVQFFIIPEPDRDLLSDQNILEDYQHRQL